MYRLSVFFIIVLSSLLTSSAQDATNEKIAYSSEFDFAEGIFMRFHQVKNNSPIPKSQIVTTVDYNSPDFFEVALKGNQLTFFDEQGLKRYIRVGEIWGYSRNGNLYINLNGEFNRVTIVGQICHFVSHKTVVSNYTSNPYMSPYNQPYNRQGMYMPTTTKELRQYILDFETGRVMDYNYESLQTILMRDAELFDEFNKLKKKQRKNLTFVYLRKYNERNPLYIYTTSTN